MTASLVQPQFTGDVAPPALHNSGPGPMAVYRTGAVGQTFQLDLGTMLRCWTGLPAELRAPMACNPPGMDGPSPEAFCPPDKAAGIARFLLEALAPRSRARATREAHERRLATADAPRDPGERARTSIAMLAERVAEMGWLSPFYGLARWQTLNNPVHMTRPGKALQNEWPWLPAGEEHRVLRHAWSVCAVSYMSPPLILWTRPPSLTWWRGDNVILLHWLGRASVPAAAGANGGGR